MNGKSQLRHRRQVNPGSTLPKNNSGKTMKTLLISAVFAAALFSATAPAEAAECGKASIAEMRWASAGIAANFDKIILEKGYGCSVTIVDGDTLPTFASMNEKGTPDIASEYWINSVRALLDQAVNTGRLVQGAEILADGAVEGWFIPKFIADANPDIRSVEDLAPERPQPL